MNSRLRSGSCGAEKSTAGCRLLWCVGCPTVRGNCSQFSADLGASRRSSSLRRGRAEARDVMECSNFTHKRLAAPVLMLSAPGPLADRARAIATAVCKRNESKGGQEQKGWNAPGRVRRAWCRAGVEGGMFLLVQCYCPATAPARPKSVWSVSGLAQSRWAFPGLCCSTGTSCRSLALVGALQGSARSDRLPERVQELWNSGAQPRHFSGLADMFIALPTGARSTAAGLLQLATGPTAQRRAAIAPPTSTSLLFPHSGSHQHNGY